MNKGKVVLQLGKTKQNESRFKNSNLKIAVARELSLHALLFKNTID